MGEKNFFVERKRFTYKYAVLVIFLFKVPPKFFPLAFRKTKMEDFIISFPLPTVVPTAMEATLLLVIHVSKKS